MASDVAFLEFVADQMSGAGRIASRKMFGEYAIYCDAKVVALVCDNQLFVKPTERGRVYIGDVVEAPPYPGAKLYFLVEDRFEDREWLSALIKITTQELPDSKPKQSKSRRAFGKEKGNEMIANTLSPCIATENVEESRDFYVKHFGAKVTFDCGWYVNMQIGKETSEVQFMAPRHSGPPACNPAGLMYNFSVDDVDAEHARLTAAGLTPIIPLEDHPWGDRGFAILDPNGVTLYIYSPREPAKEFKQYVKE